VDGEGAPYAALVKLLTKEDVLLSELACRVLVRDATRLPYSDATVANRIVWDFGWEIAHEAVSRRAADFPLHDGTPYRGLHVRLGVWDLSIVQGPFSVAPYQTLTHYSQLLHCWY
jgi:hypothetical protein